MSTVEFEKKTKELIDGLKSVCAQHGLGNDGNEFKVITQVFLYKFLNDKFIHEVKKLDKAIAKAENWDEALKAKSEEEYEFLMLQLDENTARIEPDHFISSLFERQNEPEFAKIFDDTLLDIAKVNSELFSVLTSGGEKVRLFDKLSSFVEDNKDEFCRALLNKLVGFSFEHIFHEKFDFYSTIFEYLIKDYNSNSGGKYAEYFTPHAVAKIMARCLVNVDVKNVKCYDPSAGSGTLLMNLAHQIGEDRCTIYSQDISQKSSHLLRLNLVLNGLVHSIPNIVKGNTIQSPYHRTKSGQLQEFDFIVSNPPFKLDFSEYRNELDVDANSERFFAGIPNVPKKKKESMAIYLLFIQHIMHSLSEKGKAAVVVPTGFITAQSGIDKKIREKLVKEKMLAGVVSMPSNIFATTGTNVSILFIDKENKEDVVLVDASGLGTKVKVDDKNQKTVLSGDEEDKIIETFNQKEAADDFSVVVSYEEIEAKNYSLSAGQYFEVRIEYSHISIQDFEKRISDYDYNLKGLFKESKELESSINEHLSKLNYDL
ncbi:HsdM family class I SAM-dependent methyltransferase [Ekhidna sp.]|uniref:HsdM family class I SAM-dependent methyltransferase n=1 Tax=Ekhidna sp. TaxID=2608089 RepID=UPI003C7A5738